MHDNDDVNGNDIEYDHESSDSSTTGGYWSFLWAECCVMYCCCSPKEESIGVISLLSLSSRRRVLCSSNHDNVSIQVLKLSLTQNATARCLFPKP